MLSLLPALLAIPLMLILMTPLAHAASLHYVAPGGSCGGPTPCYATVQAAVDAAGSGDQVPVAAGTYTGIQARGNISEVVYISKTVMIQGGYTTGNWITPAPFANLTTLDAQGQGIVLVVTGNISPTIAGLHMTGGNAGTIFPPGSASGGGIYIFSATATLNGNVIFGNKAANGGGVYLNNSVATLNANTIYSNTGSRGGGVYMDSSPAQLSGNAIMSNTASFDGGGIYLYHSDALLRGNTISNNADFGHEGGGGVYIANCNPTLDGNTIINNRATNGTSGGGVVVAYYSNVTLSSNAIMSNTASGSGGGLFVFSSNTIMNSNVFVGNHATDGGGLVVGYTSNATMTNNLIADNYATSSASGAYVGGGESHLLHTTFVRNGGGDGAGVIIGTTGFLTNSIFSSHSVGISITLGSTAFLDGVLWFNNGTNIAGPVAMNATNQHSGDPLFAADGYHLTSGSAAIDQGIHADVTIDIDGQPQPHGAAPDLGADEYYLLGHSTYLPFAAR